jgi:hypothetical protein
MTMPEQLHCLIVDAGPAAYLKPVVADWIENPPPFDWSIRLGEKAAHVFESVAGLNGHRGADLAQTDSAPERVGDAMLISAGGWPVEKAHVRAGRAQGAPSIQFVDTCYNYARRLCDDGVWTLPDLLLLVTERSIAEAEAEGVPTDICRAVGHPLWGQLAPLPASETGDILFVGAPVERDYGKTLGYTESDAWCILQEVLAADPGFDGRLCYARHPEQSPESLPAGIDLVGYHPDVLARFDTVVGMFSAPLVDAYLAGRRSVSLQPNGNVNDMFFLSRQGYLPRATDRDTLVAALAAPPPDPGAFAREVRGSGARLNKVLGEVLAA